MEPSMTKGRTRRTVAGAFAGAAATVPMTAAMEAMLAELPFWERHALPPRKITARMLRRAGVSGYFDGSTLTAATLVNHFGYGSACGAAYALGCPARYLGVGSGVAFGLAVWAGSYLGWLPAARLMLPATLHARRRNALMIAAHVVWGAAAGAIARAALRGSDAQPEKDEPFAPLGELDEDETQHAAVV